MQRLHTRFTMTSLTGAVLLAAIFMSADAAAVETAGQKIEGVAQKTVKGIRKGAEWTGNGIRKGISKTGEGISKGITHAAKGINKGARKTGEAFARVGNKLQHAAS